LTLVVLHCRKFSIHTIQTSCFDGMQYKTMHKKKKKKIILLHCYQLKMMHPNTTLHYITDMHRYPETIQSLSSYKVFINEKCL
jgi:hypothetical protein